MKINDGRKHTFIYLICAFVITTFSAQAFADRRTGDGEVTIALPYTLSQKYGSGATTIDTNAEVGFGLGINFNYSDNLAFSGQISWNNIKYKANGVLTPPEPEPADPMEVSFKGKMSTWSILLGGDYYFSRNKISPFVNGSVGWTFVDSKIPDGPPGTVCWWDFYWGYICSGYQNTHTYNEFNYGVGAGVRMEINRTTFLKLGYYNQWISSESMDMMRLELGFTF